jgi:hypothetical protein
MDYQDASFRTVLKKWANNFHPPEDTLEKVLKIIEAQGSIRTGKDDRPDQNYTGKGKKAPCKEHPVGNK